MKTKDDAGATWGDTGSGTMDLVGSVVVGMGGGEGGRLLRDGEAARGGQPKRHPGTEEEAQEEDFLLGTGRGCELVQNSKKAEASRRLRRVVQQAVLALHEAVAIIVQGRRRRRRGGSS